MVASMASSTMPISVTSLPTSDQLPTSANGMTAANASLNENNFFQLLTAQLENQDPLNPLSASDFAAELAQFSTAIGVQQLQSTQTSYGNLQLSSMVGRNVAVTGSSLVLNQNGTATGAFNLSGASSDVQVAITDSTGNTLQTLDLGAQPSAGSPPSPGMGSKRTVRPRPRGPISSRSALSVPRDRRSRQRPIRWCR